MNSVQDDRSTEDDFLDELVPEDLDWRPLVRRYPVPALILAAVGGYVLGRGRGTEIIAGVSEFAADAISEGVNEFLGKEVL